MSHVRIRCTGLIIQDNSVLLIEYDDNGVHYNLPGGGLEPGETIVEGVSREVFVETTAEVDVGSLALIYELAPHKQSGDSVPRLPQNPDPHQSAVKWVPLEELDTILLIPNINQQIKNYIKSKRNIELIEDYTLDRLRLDLK